MQSHENQILRTLFRGKPIHANWIKDQPRRLAAIRKLWGQGLIESVKIDHETQTVTYQAREVTNK